MPYSRVRGERSNCLAEAYCVILTPRRSAAYRGIMIDLARNFHPVDYLKRYIVMCRVYKLNYIHLHFSDDQAFAFPSTAFPNL